MSILFTNPLSAMEHSSIAWPNADTPFGVQASRFSLSGIEHLNIPEPEKDGKIKTLNAMGFMTPDLDETTQDFIDFSAKSELPVLDGGAAYGIASIPALKKGAKVIANDIDPRHLLLLLKTNSLSAEEKNRLYLNNDSLPNAAHFPENSLGAILLCRVMHFFSPQDVQNMFAQAKKWLAPGGRFYVITMTPYHYSLTGFPSIYHQRWQAGDKWPGIITSMTTDYLPENKGKIPDFLHVMDMSPLIRVAEEHGFIAKKMELFGHHRNPKENGLGYIGAVFIKPQVTEREKKR